MLHASMDKVTSYRIKRGFTDPRSYLLMGALHGSPRINLYEIFLTDPCVIFGYWSWNERNLHGRYPSTKGVHHLCTRKEVKYVQKGTIVEDNEVELA